MLETVQIPNLVQIHASPQLNFHYRHQLTAFLCEMQEEPTFDVHWISVSEEDAMFLFSDDLIHMTLESLVTLFDIFFGRFPEGLLVIPNYTRLATTVPSTHYQLLLGSLLFQALQGHRILPVRPEDVGLVIFQYAKRVQYPRDHHTQGRYKPKLESLQDQRQFLVEGLMNCGEKKSDLLLQQFPMPYDLFKTIIETPEAILQIKGFGPEFITSNTRLLTEQFPLPSQEEDPCD